VLSAEKNKGRKATPALTRIADLDPQLSRARLVKYAGLSVRTLRGYVDGPPGEAPPCDRPRPEGQAAPGAGDAHITTDKKECEMTEPLITVRMYRSLDDATDFLTGLALLEEPWTFDIETYDDVVVPSRKEVAVDSFHPDFRVRGVAIATSTTGGAWVDFARRQPSDFNATHRGLVALRAAFGSPTEKGAYNGGFDESGLIVSGWVPAVRNRARDGMLAVVALGDGTHESLTLSHVVKVLLGHEPYWDVDKGLMRDLPIETIARGSVTDACYTFELCDLCDTIADKDERIEWSKMQSRGVPKALNKEFELEEDTL
jgi:hypothetical protein